MKRIAIVTFTTIALLSLVPSALAQAPALAHYFAVQDWSSQSNPNGVWSYGYLTAWGAPFALYTSNGDCGMTGTSNWFLFANLCNPHIGHNDTGKPVCYTTACLPPQYLALHPGPNGEISVLRWTAPARGTYQVQVLFEGIDSFFPTSTNVYVVRNSTRILLKAPINSYEIPLTFYPPAFNIGRGGTLDFMVDWGNDGSYIGDSTGAQVKIWLLQP